MQSTDRVNKIEEKGFSTSVAMTAGATISLGWLTIKTPNPKTTVKQTSVEALYTYKIIN